MNRPVEDLDRMIDALNANRDPADEGPVDSDTSELLDLAHGLKELGHTQWPDESFPTRAAIRLSMKLGPTSRFAVIARGYGNDADSGDGDDSGPLPPLPTDLDQFPERPRGISHPRHWRRPLEIAAAVAVLVLFTGMVTMLLKNANGGTADPTAQPGGNPAFGSSSQSTATTDSAPASTGVSTQSSTAASTPTSNEISVSTTAPTQSTTSTQADDQSLVALQGAAGFDLWQPGSIPVGLTLKQPDAPMSLPSFTSVTLKYVDADGAETLVITEASPYQDSAQTMPADVWNNAVPVNLGNGVTGHLYKRGPVPTDVGRIQPHHTAESDIQLWWEEGQTSIRLETGGSPGTDMLTQDQMMAIAISMRKVGSAAGQSGSVPSISGDAKVQTSDQAVARAQDLINSLGGNGAAVPANVTLTVVSNQTALGMPQPEGFDGAAPVWSVYFKDGMTPAHCEQTGSSSLCSHGEITVIVDALSGDVLSYHGFDGAWKQP